MSYISSNSRYNMRSGEALCRYRVMNKDELLQEIYSDNLFIALAT